MPCDRARNGSQPISQARRGYHHDQLQQDEKKQIFGGVNGRMHFSISSDT
jgi:hypothetical protein